MSIVDSKNEPLGLTLKRIFDKTDMKIVDILSNTNVSRSFVERLFRGKESRFDLVLPIIKFLECDEKTLISQYCEEIQMASNFLYALEYCDRRNNLSQLERLLERSKGKTLPQLREMRELYAISLKRKKDGSKENLEKTLLQAREFNASTTVSRTFHKLVEIQLFYELKEFGVVHGLLKELKVEKIDDAFFSESFQWRLNQVQQSIALRFNADFEKTRELAFELIRISDSKYFHAFAYGHLGLSYAFTYKKEEALRYLNKSQQLYKATGMVNNVWDETIEFFKILWGQQIEPEDVSSLKNLALMLIKSGKSFQSRPILDKIEQVEGVSPMSLFLRGLATQDADYHWQSLEIYIRDRGDRLFAILPRNELIRLKENKFGVNALYNIISIK